MQEKIKECEVESSTLASSQPDCSVFDDDIKNYQQNKLKNEKTIEEQEEKIQILTSSLKISKENITKLEEQIKVLNMTVGNVTKVSGSEINVTEVSGSEINSTYDRIQFENLNKTNVLLKTESKSKDKEISVLKNEQKTQNTTLLNKQKELDNLNKTYIKVKENVKIYETHLKIREKHVSNLQNDLKTRSERITKLEKDVDDKNERISKLQAGRTINIIFMVIFAIGCVVLGILYYQIRKEKASYDVKSVERAEYAIAMEPVLRNNEL